MFARDFLFMIIRLRVLVGILGNSLQDGRASGGNSHLMPSRSAEIAAAFPHRAHRFARFPAWRPTFLGVEPFEVRPCLILDRSNR
jgi:hypothetical protein